MNDLLPMVVRYQRGRIGRCQKVKRSKKLLEDTLRLDERRLPNPWKMSHVILGLENTHRMFLRRYTACLTARDGLRKVKQTTADFKKELGL